MHLLPLELAQPLLQVFALFGLALEEHHGSLLLLLLRSQGRQLALDALSTEERTRARLTKVAVCDTNV